MKITKLISPDPAGHDLQKEQFAIDVLTGLSASPKTIPAKYFYDDSGSKLFQQITAHKDYYLTCCELEILKANTLELPEIVGEQEIDIIELGPGDGHKSRLTIEGFLGSGCRVNYYPIDISEAAMKMLGDNMARHDSLKIHGVVAEYFEGLRLVRQQSNNRQLVLFLGSNIGNFNRVQNQGFLRRLWMSMNLSDYLLIGFDLKKDVGILTAAYNDADGLTRRFNLNVLRRINRELGGSFDIDKFQHFGVYNPFLGAMESYVLATEPQDIYIADIERSFPFEAFEPIHLEYSFKFLNRDIEFLAEKAGFEIVRNFNDTSNYFTDSLWQAVKH